MPAPPRAVALAAGLAAVAGRVAAGALLTAPGGEPVALANDGSAHADGGGGGTAPRGDASGGADAPDGGTTPGDDDDDDDADPGAGFPSPTPPVEEDPARADGPAPDGDDPAPDGTTDATTDDDRPTPEPDATTNPLLPLPSPLPPGEDDAGIPSLGPAIPLVGAGAPLAPG